MSHLKGLMWFSIAHWAYCSVATSALSLTVSATQRLVGWVGNLHCFFVVFNCRFTEWTVNENIVNCHLCCLFDMCWWIVQKTLAPGEYAQLITAQCNGSPSAPAHSRPKMADFINRKVGIFWNWAFAFFSNVLVFLCSNV